MTGDEGAGREDPEATLFATVADPAGARRRLPRVVGLLDHDDASVRIGAGWAVCAVAAAVPDAVPYLARRLADRLASDDPAVAVELAFAYLDERYPEVVDEELAAAAEADARSSVTPIRGNLARANYHLPEIGDRGVGRTRLPGEGGGVDPRQVYTDQGDAHREPADGDGNEPDVDGSDGNGTTSDDTPAGGSDDDADEAAEGDTDAGGPSAKTPRGADAEVPDIVYESQFDRLRALGRRPGGRYAAVYRTLGEVDGDELPVALALYHRPADDGADVFANAVGDHLERWRGVADHDNVVTVYDWGRSPRPWSATEYTGERLAGRGDLTFDEALWNARLLADALEHVHENGVVHGGIDPRNVAYYGTVLDEHERRPPLLDNVGLMHVVRRFFDPTGRLDPRYAAPEYFDDRYGRIDHATDVYQLGAVLYRLFTGKAPYDGDYETVREAVLEYPPPRPSAVTDVPPAVDDAVTKAMAGQKLRRYETVAHLAAELRGVEAGDDAV